MEDIRTMAGAPYPVIRIMPNTPVAVGSGVVLYDATENVAEPVLEQFCQGLRFAGLLDRLPEHLIDAGSAVAGCGPAFIYPYIEALADGSVMAGLPRDKALRYAAQTVLAGAGLLKNTVGVFGMVTVLSLCVVPFIRLGVHYVSYKLSAALAGTVADGRLSELISAIGTALRWCWE